MQVTKDVLNFFSFWKMVYFTRNNTQTRLYYNILCYELVTKMSKTKGEKLGCDHPGAEFLLKDIPSADTIAFPSTPEHP